MKRFIITLLAISMIVMLGACSTAEPSNKDKIDKETKETASSGIEADIETEESTSTEKDVKEETGQARGEAPDSGTLSDDIYSFQVEINGDLYQFPMKYSDFTSYGWDFKNDDTEIIDSYSIYSGTFNNNGLQGYADIINFDINARVINECYVSSITIEGCDVNKVDNFSLRLPKGLEYGKTTVEEIKEAYGIPSDTSDDEYYTNLTYKTGIFQKVDIKVSKETATVETVKIENAVKPDDFEESEVSIEVPEIVTKYKAPNKLGDGFDAYIVEFAGDLYQIPAPVSSFINNGWEINKEDSEEILSGGGSGFVSLMKDKQKLKVLCKNYSKGATAIENCFVPTVKSGDYDNNTDIKIPHNLTIGSSESDLEKVLAGVEHEKDTSSDAYNYYRIIPGESILDNYEITVTDGAISKIEVNNAPKYSEFTK